ncbi:nucleotidyltransferase family protein [Cocleimonas sp. KMM 6892]|uniref:N-acetylmuramate alpha-1-phosphate uridylyltransferase MurU n=1 Tax=unclassified Cocleimonas TaxID=2639732 RepID=UPI002DB961C4|nr:MULTISPECIES: nucleotidyltransferase family protein [unclassified Cocleimonas]MEB8430823.1 nucleotidyltransferase family protein [Cocleimonas sp. KMM 6892]MEC4714405.1 nucleotidyltransferase family protein [Cocleimonas sp. KMM 6895]MEC4743736.1 nucleotidyltransferase family protein [Cocleimonas sp. KMM 6896]
MRAMILAAGHGTRMRPLTDHTPKPLLHVGGKPLIVWHIENLQRAGFKDIVINIAWLGDLIPKALGDGAEYGVSLHYSDEQQEGALETAGGILKALPLLGDEAFLVVNGDVWCNFPYSTENPLKDDTLAHLVLVNNPPQHPEGDFSLRENIVADGGDNAFTFSGIGYYHPDLFKDLMPGKHPLAPLLRNAMTTQQVTGEHFDGDWQDIGTPERLDRLNQQLVKSALS